MISLPAGSEFVGSVGADAGSDAGAGVVSGSDSGSGAGAGVASVSGSGLL